MATNKILEVIIKAKDEATATLKKFDSQLKKNKESLDAIKKASLLAVGAVSAFAVSSVKSAIEAEQAQSQLNAVLKSTGGIAGVTAESALNLSQALQKVTTFGDEAILSAENMLLTFTKIGSNIFPQATETVLDMSIALGQDAKSSAIQLGKALNDPIQGVNALSRVGIKFTEGQKELIKTLVESGRTLDAQNLILKELSTEFGGSAKAKAKTFGGQIEQLKNSFDDLQEVVGKGLIVALREAGGQSATTEKGFKALEDATFPLTVKMYQLFNVFMAGYRVLEVIGVKIAQTAGLFKTAGLFLTGNFDEAKAYMESFQEQTTESMDKLSDAVARVINPTDFLKAGLAEFSTVAGNLPPVIGEAEEALAGLTEEEKEQAKNLKKLTDEYADFDYKITDHLESLRTKHKDSIASINTSIKTLRQSLNELASDYAKQQKSDVASIAERIVKEETDIANIRSRLANETSFEQIKALTEELKAKEEGLKQSAGFQTGIQTAMVEARRRASLSDVERAIEDFNSRRAEAEAEYNAKQNEINAQIKQLQIQKIEETKLYEKQKEELKQIRESQLMHLIGVLTTEFEITKDTVERELDLYKQLERQIDRVLSKQAQTGSKSSSKGKAIGGGVQVGQSYLVGERGPELFTPSGNGSIIPNNKLAGAGGGSITVNINGGTYLSENVAEQIGDMIIQRFKRTIRI